MALFYRLAADAVVVLHMGYVLFVVVGCLLVLIGILFRWQWIRNPWFRWMHLASILIVAAEALLGIVCPLTTWEKELRLLAGETSYRGDFIASLVHDWLFYDLPPWAFTAIYVAFAAIVLLAFAAAPPRRLRRETSP
jgi:hypothetical protein